MHWPELKERIYFDDGTWRDIYVLDTTVEDWEKWVDLVNKTYRVEFYDGKTGFRTDKIDFAHCQRLLGFKGEQGNNQCVN